MKTQHTPNEVGDCATCGHKSLAHTNAGECNYRDSGFNGTSARCACDMYAQPRQGHTPTPQDIWDHSQASLQNLWSDCPELYQRVVRAVNGYEILLQELRESSAFLRAEGWKCEADAMDRAIARAEKGA